MTTLTATEKAREKRVRRMAGRQALLLSRSRSRDPMALDYGTYTLSGFGGFALDGMSLDEAERALSTGRARDLMREREAARRARSVTVAAGVGGHPGQTRPDGPGSDPRRDPRRDPAARK